MEMKGVIGSLWTLEAVAQHQPVTAGELTNRFELPKVDRAAHAGHTQRGWVAPGEPQGHHAPGDRRPGAGRPAGGA